MTNRSANKPGDLVLTSVLWMTRFFFVASALYGAYGEQHNPDRAVSFGYVANSFDNTVSVIDTDSNKFVATIPVGTFPSGVATTPDGTRAYVTNAGSNSVSVIDTATNSVETTFGVGTYPYGVAIHTLGIGPPTTTDQCKKGGWQTFNVPRTFKNQGDCVSFVNTGK